MDGVAVEVHPLAVIGEDEAVVLADEDAIDDPEERWSGGLLKDPLPPPLPEPANLALKRVQSIVEGKLQVGPRPHRHELASASLTDDPHLLATVPVVAGRLGHDPHVDEIAVPFGQNAEAFLHVAPELGSETRHVYPVDFHPWTLSFS